MQIFFKKYYIKYSLLNRFYFILFYFSYFLKGLFYSFKLRSFFCIYCIIVFVFEYSTTNDSDYIKVLVTIFHFFMCLISYKINIYKLLYKKVVCTF